MGDVCCLCDDHGDDCHTHTGEEVLGAKQLFNEAGNDVEMKEMARAEIKDLESQQEQIEERLVVLMLPQVKMKTA